MMLVSYIRDKNSRPIGTVVALNRNEIGVAICNKKDRFNKIRGKDIAMARALQHKMPKVNSERLRILIDEGICRMEERARKYFK